MTNSQNDIEIYQAIGNANTKRQENEIAAIMKTRNEAGCITLVLDIFFNT